MTPFPHWIARALAPAAVLALFFLLASPLLSRAAELPHSTAQAEVAKKKKKKHRKRRHQAASPAPGSPVGTGTGQSTPQLPPPPPPPPFENSCAPDDGFEPDDDFPTAFAIPYHYDFYDAPSLGRTHCKGDPDFFQATVPGGALYVIRVAPSGGLDASVRTYDADHQLIWTYDAAGANGLETAYLNNANGEQTLTGYVEVRGHDADTAGAYSLTAYGI